MPLQTDPITRRVGQNTAWFLERFRPGPLVVNLGIGIPTMACEFFTRKDIYIHAENGMLGLGPLADIQLADPALVNAAMQPATETVGCSYFDLSASFALIRGGHLDLVVLGAFEVSEGGDVANWTLPGRLLGVGGAMDLAASAGTLAVAMTQCTPSGALKMVKTCTLPVTSRSCADYVITENAVFHRRDGRFALEAIVPGRTPGELKPLIAFDISVSENLQTLSAP